MPNKSGGAPGDNPNPQSSAPSSVSPLPKKGIVASGGTSNSDQKNDNNSSELKKEIHWINHATFWSQVGLGIIGLCALAIYYCQLQQMIVATKATKSAADTARDALHITERAYIEILNPRFDFAAGSVPITFANVGHIPSGKMNVRVFELTAAITNLPPDNPRSTQLWTKGTIAERNWHDTSIPSIPSSSRNDFRILTGATADAVDGGHEVVYIGGLVSYNDGFPDTPERKDRFCYYSNYAAQDHSVTFLACKPNDLDTLMKTVGSPQYESK